MDREQRERLVNGALARALEPKNVTPREGFEERLLANLAAQPLGRPWWRWLWVPAVAAAAVLAIVLGARLWSRPTPKVIESRQVPARVQPQAPTVAHITAERDGPPSVTAKRRTPRTTQTPRIQLARATPPNAMPKQEVFPTPLPMTEQERLLLALVHRRPAQAQLIAAEQEADRQQIQKYLETVSAPPEAAPAQHMQ